jgi:hypothetical protein
MQYHAYQLSPRVMDSDNTSGILKSVELPKSKQSGLL